VGYLVRRDLSDNGTAAARAAIHRLGIGTGRCQSERRCSASAPLRRHREAQAGQALGPAVTPAAAEPSEAAPRASTSPSRASAAIERIRVRARKNLMGSLARTTRVAQPRSSAGSDRGIRWARRRSERRCSTPRRCPVLVRARVSRERRRSRCTLESRTLLGNVPRRLVRDPSRSLALSRALCCSASWVATAPFGVPACVARSTPGKKPEPLRPPLDTQS
jgi:hypothetical protein